jgi:hypothetical protein
MRIAVLHPVLIALLLLVVERSETRVCEPGAEDPDGPVPQGSPDDDRTGRRPGAPYPAAVTDSRAPNAAGRSPGDGTVRPLGPAVTAMHPSACPVATSEARFHGDRHTGNEADIDRQDPGRRIGGRGPWTHR